MARKTLEIERVKVLFSAVTNVDDLSKKYQIVIELTEEQSADYEAAGITVKMKEYKGKPQFKATLKSKFRPPIVAVDGKTTVDLGGGEIGRGSLINVGVSFRPWDSPDGSTSGIAQDLSGIQILVMQQGAVGFSDQSEEDFGEGADDEDM